MGGLSGGVGQLSGELSLFVSAHALHLCLGHLLPRLFATDASLVVFTEALESAAGVVLVVVLHVGQNEFLVVLTQPPPLATVHPLHLLEHLVVARPLALLSSWFPSLFCCQVQVGQRMVVVVVSEALILACVP